MYLEARKPACLLVLPPAYGFPSARLLVTYQVWLPGGVSGSQGVGGVGGAKETLSP